MAIIYMDIPLVKGDGGEWNICFHAVNEWPRLLLPRIDNGGLVPSEAFAVSGQEESEPRGEPMADRALVASGTNRFVFFGLI